MIRTWIAPTLVAVTLISSRSAEAADSFTVLARFTAESGTKPAAGVILDTQGNIYGTTTHGGPLDLGTVYKCSNTGVLTALYGFSGLDGARPSGKLTTDSQGNLYGTTRTGGLTNGGTVFQISAAGTFKSLHAFRDADGTNPSHGVTLDPQGNIYGTTSSGGANELGTAFQITPAGAFAVLHNFTNIDGVGNDSGLVLDSQGNLFGSTMESGVNAPLSAGGTIYRITPAGVFSVVYTFNSNDGDAFPFGDLAIDAAGNLYGAANQGIYLFKLTPKGVKTTLRTFPGLDTLFVSILDLATGSVTLDSSGNLYGTTILSIDNVPVAGTIYTISSTGVFKRLYAFTELDGTPNDGLAIDSAGNIYGTTTSATGGILFKLTTATP